VCDIAALDDEAIINRTRGKPMVAVNQDVGWCARRRYSPLFSPLDHRADAPDAAATTPRSSARVADSAVSRSDELEVVVTI